MFLLCRKTTFLIPFLLRPTLLMLFLVLKHSPTHAQVPLRAAAQQQILTEIATFAPLHGRQLVTQSCLATETVCNDGSGDCCPIGSICTFTRGNIPVCRLANCGGERCSGVLSGLCCEPGLTCNEALTRCVSTSFGFVGGSGVRVTTPAPISPSTTTPTPTFAIPTFTVSAAPAGPVVSDVVPPIGKSSTSASATSQQAVMNINGMVLSPTADNLIGPPNGEGSSTASASTSAVVTRPSNGEGSSTASASTSAVVSAAPSGGAAPGLLVVDPRFARIFVLKPLGWLAAVVFTLWL